MRYFGEVIHNPRYLIHYYPHLPEGEVPDNIRRRFGSYMGFDNGRKDGGDLILGVHESSDKKSPYYYLEILEVIDNDTLWHEVDGWLFQLRRKGSKGQFVPLEDRNILSDKYN